MDQPEQRTGLPQIRVWVKDHPEPVPAAAGDLPVEQLSPARFGTIRIWISSGEATGRGCSHWWSSFKEQAPKRRAIIAQDEEKGWVTFAEYDRNYLQYLPGEARDREDQSFLDNEANARLTWKSKENKNVDTLKLFARWSLCTTIGNTAETVDDGFVWLE
ncbi:hypothetical protein B7463_g11970, partial [Scytalidium lignicola]